MPTRGNFGWHRGGRRRIEVELEQADGNTLREGLMARAAFRSSHPVGLIKPVHGSLATPAIPRKAEGAPLCLLRRFVSPSHDCGVLGGAFYERGCSQRLNLSLQGDNI